MNRGRYGAHFFLPSVQQQLREVAETDLTVLLLGDPGPGRQRAAQRVHKWSHRREEIFVHLHCRDLREEEAKSGPSSREPDAFTRAISSTVGPFGLAPVGTIFLDEIGDLSLASQSGVLRVLREGCIERIGETGLLPVDGRIVAASSQDLGKAVQEGRFLRDLNYRLNVVPVQVPAEWECREDVSPFRSGAENPLPKYPNSVN